MAAESRPLVPSYIEELTSYEPGKTIAEVNERYQPRKISKLASNENRLGCSERVPPAVEAVLADIQDYPDPIARRLRRKIADRNGVSPENVILAAGSESLIANMFRTFFCEGEEALTADATFVGLYVQAGIENVRVRKVPLDAEYRFDLKAMAKAIDEQTKVVYIANPNNPTGTYVTKAAFETFMNLVPEDVLVVMDEAYYEYARGIKDYPRALDYDYKNLLTLRTFSKAYGLAGFRIGYGIGHADLIHMMMKTKLTFEPTAPAQAAAEAAYDDSSFIDKSLEMVADGKERLYRFFEEYEIDFVPTVSNAVMIVLPDASVTTEITAEMMKKGVILRQATAFGLPNCIRITIGTRDEIDHFMESFSSIYNQLFVKKNA
ncbi:MAG: histidinol-phosphate transaminase [Balneolaceae bacterium]|nr:histidinol-phosphate transaminase [Balneolaceae bacterium]